MGFVDHLRLSVRDVAASLAFYDPWLRVIGFAEVERDDDGAAWGLPDEQGRTEWLILTPARQTAIATCTRPGCTTASSSR